MWEAIILLRLLASASQRLSLDYAGRGLPLSGRGLPLALPVDTLKGAIRLSFAAWRLSLPISQPLDNHGHHDRKIA
ncbi:hypothetical protein EN943_27395 [Mesorhizobium sp. M7A.F.Ca.US.006.01.1.1]|uniref:hypothetical protein n=1 Tax=Mesorhizobium sp. M7A.F.Ca.US.006.01.1.1 TaxID=2496707 RepID=UPI000FCC90E5|nr:hypothetical protein [Mesorhizobium sp. M7A.F.Ca.US.006.01.1.1]RUZ73373.1 hypothetical protein EN943_27395 [Mesorhizobium sp. M7A.F.Ca.US.006.01.1.1]